MAWFSNFDFLKFEISKVWRCEGLKVWNMNVWKFGTVQTLKVWKFESLKVWMFDNSKVWKSAGSKVRKCEMVQLTCYLAGWLLAWRCLASKLRFRLLVDVDEARGYAAIWPHGYMAIWLYASNMSGFINPHTRQFPLQSFYSLEKPQCRRIFVGSS